MITSASNFVNSSFAVGHNAVKSILFRIAGIAVHIAAFKLFSLLASVRSAFTSYLMFTEDYIQRFVFIFSRGFSHHAALVLFLTNFLLGAGLYDTLLWGLDSPGYIAMKKNMTGASVKPQMLKRPGAYEQQFGSQNNTGARFFEEIDTSAVLIISGTLGDGSSNISSKAFNQQAFEWLAKNENRLDNLVLSRGYIMAIDPALVTLEISRVRPAMSYLQVLLVILPVVLAAITWGLLRFFAASHYSSSLLANLYATTNVRDTDTSADPQYIHTIPDIDLVRKDGKVLMATSGGVFTHCEEQSNVASVNVANQKLEYPKSSYPPNNNSYYYESPALVPG
ncbi:conserved hypothetical protein [Coccidioides posadasii str. Silveira]|uniref:Uncharacterized protein n=1 Tax=Coccidioides posadasii (strain RMSCC 757 / Silveira) TaxID=443226 RepID=E9CYK4_COCPS|nr:conserved hypothetical protein [Coccidioides posadasii str. Silveira]